MLWEGVKELHTSKRVTAEGAGFTSKHKKFFIGGLSQESNLFIISMLCALANFQRSKL